MEYATRDAADDTISRHIKLRIEALAELVSAKQAVQFERARATALQVRICELTALTDTLAKRCAEQAKKLAELMRPDLSAEEARAAIMARADEDGALHGDAIEDVLRKLGAR